MIFRVESKYELPNTDDIFNTECLGGDDINIIEGDIL